MIDETQEMLEEELDGKAQVTVVLSVMGNKGKYQSKLSKQMTLDSYNDDSADDWFYCYDVFINPKMYENHTPKDVVNILVNDFTDKAK
tara:strand:+ start:803 stop:1066 length:264 start_codon:yes stop_codon:yes gene_type:complete